RRRRKHGRCAGSAYGAGQRHHRQRALANRLHARARGPDRSGSAVGRRAALRPVDAGAVCDVFRDARWADLSPAQLRLLSAMSVDLESLDLGSLAHFLGLAFNEQVVKALEAQGFPHVKVTYGYVFQCLLEGPHTASEIARRINVTQQAAAKVVSELL